MMQPIKIASKHRFEYILFHVFISLRRFFPASSSAIIKILTCSFKIISRRHQVIVLNNLGLAFPDQKQKTLLRWRRQIYQHFAFIIQEILWLYVYRDPARILSRTKVKNGEILFEILKKSSGLIVFSAHFGNWEFIPLILSHLLKRKIYSIARPLDNPLLEQKVKEFRQFLGSHIIDKKGSMRQTVRALDQNEIVYYLIDQNTHPKEAVWVNFFAHPVTAVTSVAKFYLKRKIPIVPVFLYYEQSKIIFEILNPVHYDATGNEKNDIIALTQKCTSIIEEKIRQFPIQWFWFHQRWKNTMPRSKT